MTQRFSFSQVGTRNLDCLVADLAMLGSSAQVNCTLYMIGYLLSHLRWVLSVLFLRIRTHVDIHSSTMTDRQADVYVCSTGPLILKVCGLRLSTKYYCWMFQHSCFIFWRILVWFLSQMLYVLRYSSLTHLHSYKCIYAVFWKWIFAPRAHKCHRVCVFTYCFFKFQLFSLPWPYVILTHVVLMCWRNL